MLPPEIQSLRAEIDEIDSKIVDLLASRFRLTSNVGKLKAAHALEAVDPEREATQEVRFRELARHRNLNPDLVLRVFRSVIDEVVKTCQSTRTHNCRKRCRRYALWSAHLHVGAYPTPKLPTEISCAGSHSFQTHPR